MYGDIPKITKCCFCAPLRYGLLVWAYLKLVISIAILGLGLLWLLTFFVFLFFSDDIIFILAIICVVLIVLFFDIVFNFVLIVGAHKKNTTLLRLYYRYGIAFAVVIVASGLLCIAFVVTSFSSKKGSPFSDPSMWCFVAYFSSAVFAALILHGYLLILIRSEILKLKTNGHFKFVNHTADPACIMQGTDDVEISKKSMDQEK